MERSFPKTWILFAALFLLAPLYVWRFSIGGLPTNFLMLISFLVIGLSLLVVWRNKLLLDLIDDLKNLPKPILIGTILISLASIVSLFVQGITSEKISQWVVLYVQPIIIFSLLHFFSKSQPELLSKLKSAIYVFLFAAGLLALLQYFTLWTLPADWLGNMNEPKRAIAFFAHPNSYALFITPLLAWLIPDFVRRIFELWGTILNGKSWWQQFGVIARQKFFVLAWLVGAVGLLLSLSRGAWLGLLAAAAVYAVLSANKKVLITFLLGAVVVAGVVFAVPNLRWRVLLPFHGEKSSLARFSLWETGSKMIVDSPIVGKGISGFANNWYQYNTDPNLDHYNFSHNIFLDFWIDLGLLGLVGFLILAVWIIWHGIIKRNQPLALSLLLFMVALLIHGLIDNPYFKNDLALIFWMILALSI